MGEPIRSGEVIAEKYRLEGEIGRGGIGVVFAAEHLTLRRRVALKFLRMEVASDPEVVERFLREARAAARLRSEHVARVMDAGAVESGAAYMVMELLEGRDFDAVLAEDGPLPIDAAVDYVMQACEAVAEAHALGIVHRDLKSANLFLTRGADGAPLVKVLDFGLSKVESSESHAKLTSRNHVFGSPHFMSPEQMRSSRDVDARSDIWSLGVVLYAFLAGRVPFEGVSLPEVCSAVLLGAAPRLSSVRPGVPAGLEAVVERCLRQDLADRFQSVSELAAALAPFNTMTGAARAATIDRLAPSPTLSTTLRRRPGRTRRYAALAALAGLLTAAGAAALLHRPSSVAAASPAPAQPATPAAIVADTPAASVESSIDPPPPPAPPAATPLRRPTGAGARPAAPPPARPRRKSEADVILQLPH
jgi:serine/threonine protein kinase